MDLRRSIKGNGSKGMRRKRVRRKEEERERRKRAMTCSVISVLCIRLRLIYRQPRRGTGCAPGAHPGPSHASALPAYPLSSPLPLLGSFSFRNTFLFPPVLPSFDLSEKKDLAISFLFVVLAFSLSFQEYFPNLFLSWFFVYLAFNRVCEISIVPLQAALYTL